MDKLVLGEQINDETPMSRRAFLQGRVAAWFRNVLRFRGELGDPYRAIGVDPRRDLRQPGTNIRGKCCRFFTP